MMDNKAPIIKFCEEKAIEHFGADKIGTKELRLALPKEKKEELLSFLMQTYYENTRGNVWVRFF